MHRTTVAVRDLPPRDPGRLRAVAELELMLVPQDRKCLRVLTCAQLCSREELARFEATFAGSGDMLDALFVPEASPDVDTVLRGGLASLRATEHGLKFGRYFGTSLLRGQRQMVVLCRVAVGKSLARSAEDADRIAALPPDYQSLYSPGVAASPAAAAAAAQASSQAGTDGSHSSATVLSAASFSDLYCILDASRALATHAIEFELSASGMPAAVLCGLCGAAAAVRCAACTSAFCTNCDRAVHVGGTLARHTRAPALDGVGDLQWCAQHPRHLCDRFCLLCGEEVCVQCKMDGGAHSGREHELYTFEAAQSRALQEMAELVTRRSALSARLQELQADTERLGAQSHQRAAALRDVLARQLHAYLLTVQAADERRFELARTASDLERWAEYVQFLQQQQSAPAFLRAWVAAAPSRHALRQRVLRLSESAFPLPPLSEAGADVAAASEQLAELRRQLALRDRQIATLRRQLLDLGHTPLPG